MDRKSTGTLIKKLRTEKGLTQQELADRISVTDKAVSKWERDIGLPEQSILGELASVLGVEAGTLLSGEIRENPKHNGNLKKTVFYICPVCGNIITAMGEATVSCCGKIITPQEMVKAPENERLKIEQIENEYYISTEHEMTKEHYISFFVLLTDDTMMMKKLYPQWNAETRFPRKHGKLIWYCTEHGLMYQLI